MTIFHIKMSKENEAEGFGALLTSGTSVYCLKDEEYIITDLALGVLQERNISFEVIGKK